MTPWRLVSGAYLAAQLLHDGVDDMHAQAGAALATLGREEGFEHVLAHGRCQADTVIGEFQRQPLPAITLLYLYLRTDRYLPRPAMWISVTGAVHQQIRQDL